MDDRTLTRFLAKVATNDDGCWIWTAATNPGNGYGRFYGAKSDPKHSSTVAHRVAYEHYVGVIRDGMELDHLCKVRSCVNPDHLEQVTRAENVDRSTVREIRTGEHNHRSKLTELDVRKIRARDLTARGSKSALARELGVSVQTVTNVLAGISWGHVS